MADSTITGAQGGPADGSQPQALLISVAELAKILGISSRTVWRLHSGGKIVPPVRIGGAVRWRRSEVLAWIDEGCPEVSQPANERN